MQNIKRKYLISAIMLFLFFIVIFQIVRLNSNDGMKQAGIVKLDYRTYTIKKGWSNWSSNGTISGDKKEKIQKIQFKFGIFNTKSFSYSVYDKKSKKWKENINYNETTKKMEISGIKISPALNISKKYEICYRTYNKSDKWLEWTCDRDVTSGNAKENITALEVKIIPKNVVKNEYLKDYNLKKIDPFKNF